MTALLVEMCEFHLSRQIVIQVGKKCKESPFSALSYSRASEINPAQRNVCQQQKEGGNKEGSPEVNAENDWLFGRAKCVFGWGIESTAGHRRELGQTGFVSVMNEVFLRIGNHGAGHLRIHDLPASFLHDIHEIRSDIIRRKVKLIPPWRGLRHAELLLFQVRSNKGNIAFQLVQKIPGLPQGRQSQGMRFPFPA